MFRVVSGPFVYTAISVVNALQRSGRRFLSVSLNWTTPDRQYQIHTGKLLSNLLCFQHLKCLCQGFVFEFDPNAPHLAVLQFVPSHIDVRICNFSESIEKGLTTAFAEVRRRSKESTNFTVHVSGTRGQGSMRSLEQDIYLKDVPIRNNNPHLPELLTSSGS